MFWLCMQAPQCPRAAPDKPKSDISRQRVVFCGSFSLDPNFISSGRKKKKKLIKLRLLGQGYWKERGDLAKYLFFFFTDVGN